MHYVFTLMPRSPVRTILRITCGAAMSLAAPATAIAHGHAHAELIEHAGHHATPVAADVPEVESHGQHDGHDHPVLGPGWYSRLNAVSLPILVPTQLTWEPPTAAARPSAPQPVPCDDPPWSLRARPSRPRAPPVL